MNSFLPCLNRKFLFASLCFPVVFLYCCEKGPDPVYENGMITGHVKIYDPGGTLYGKNVSIIAHGPYGSKSTLSDEAGNYKLSGLGNGTYDIEFRKEGYGIIHQPGVQIFGKDTLTYHTQLFKKATYKMPRLSQIMYNIPFEDIHSVGIVTDIPSDNTDIMQIRVFLSDTKSVSYKDYIHTEIPSGHYRDNATRLMMVEADPYYPNDGGPKFQNGQTRYMIAYVCSIDDQAYFNEYFGRPIYSTVDEQQHSQVFEINFP